MEIIAIINVVITLMLAITVGRQNSRIEDNTTYIAELEDENEYLNGLLHTPFDQINLAGLDE